MECLYCGDCCLRMSPISDGPCPNLIHTCDFYFCIDYENRPEQCRNHRFNGFRFCPIGVEKLKLTNSQDVARRINVGYEKIKLIDGKVRKKLSGREGGKNGLL